MDKEKYANSINNLLIYSFLKMEILIFYYYIQDHHGNNREV